MVALFAFDSTRTYYGTFSEGGQINTVYQAFAPTLSFATQTGLNATGLSKRHRHLHRAQVPLTNIVWFV